MSFRHGKTGNVVEGTLEVFLSFAIENGPEGTIWNIFYGY